MRKYGGKIICIDSVEKAHIRGLPTHCRDYSLRTVMSRSGYYIELRRILSRAHSYGAEFMNYPGQ